MKRFTKIFVAVLALALLVGGVVGISAAAEENDQKWVVSSNVSYADEIFPYFAIDATLAADPTNLKVTVDGEEAKLTATNKDIYGNGTVFAHVYVGTGVAPKDMAAELEIIVTYDDVVVEETTYSVAQYFYERLYKNGIVNATTASDLLKKELYIATLEYGAAANAHFAEKTDAPSPTNFAYVWGDVETAFIELTEGAAYPITVGAGETYTVTPYSLDGIGESEEIAESCNYELGGSMKITLNRYVSDAVKFDELNWDEYVSAYNKAADNITSGINNGALVLTDNHGTYTGPITIFEPTASVDTPNAVVFETDLRMVNESGTSAFSIQFLYAVDTASKTAYMLECRYDAESKLFYVGDKSSSTGSEAYNSGFYTNESEEVSAIGEWVNVRVEYYSAIDGEGNESMRALTYINGELVLTSNNWYGVTTAGVGANAIAASDISKVQMQTYGSHQGTLSVDNMKLEFTADVTPTDEVTVKYSNSISLEESGVVNLGSGRADTDDERAAVLQAAN